MKTNQIRNQINKAIAQDKKDQRFERLLKTRAYERNLNMTQDQINECVQFIYDYLLHVPAMFDTINVSSGNAGIQNLVQPLIGAVEDYFLNPYDLIPDNQGIYGLLDDAYFALKLIQVISEEYSKLKGYPLISLNLAVLNNPVRSFLPPEVVQVIEEAIGIAIMQQPIQNPFMQLTNYYNSTMFINDPMYGTCSIQDVVNAKLGAYGIV